MECKAQTAAIAVAMARICNAADRPIPQMHAPRRVVQDIQSIDGIALAGLAGQAAGMDDVLGA